MTVTVSLVKKSSQTRSAVAPKKAGPGVRADNFVFVDNEDSTCSVFGVDASGHHVDISGVATLTVTSSDTNVLTVDPPEGTKFKMHGVAPGNAVVSTTATWNDGSVGPFSFDLPVEIQHGPVTGLVVIPGTPVVR